MRIKIWHNYCQNNFLLFRLKPKIFFFFFLLTEMVEKCWMMIEILTTGAWRSWLVWLIFFSSLDFRLSSLITHHLKYPNSHTPPVWHHHSTCHHSNFSTICGPILVTWCSFYFLLFFFFLSTPNT